MRLFDPKAYHLHQQRAMKTFPSHAFLFEHVGQELVSRLQDLKATFAQALNLSPYPLPYPSHHHPFLADQLDFPENSFDLILSCLQGHWVNHLPNLLQSIHGCLRPNGLFLAALWGGQTLYELRESFLKAELSLSGGAAPRIAPMVHPADAPTLIRGFFMPVVDTETITVFYPSLISLMKDLRGMGETNTLVDRPKTFTPRTLFTQTEVIYAQTFGRPDRTIPATFEVLYLTGWKYKP